MLSMSAFIAANALVVPMRPTILDFASTAAFFSMVTSSLETWIKHGIDFHFNFESVLINGQEENKSAHREIVSALQAALPRQDIFSTTMKNSAEIDNANKMMKTVYDLNRGTTSSRATYDRCIKYFNAVNQDIENSIRRTWPSHIDGLRDEALA
jgi:chromosome partitioning protein